jgi:16S rRNA (guanine527-N7)-methyltransferase
MSSNDVNIIGERHILDSLSPLVHLKFAENNKLLDIGSGAGFPAIPLKIMRPDLRMTLVESRKKKIVFLEEMSSLLGFSDFTAKWSRIEEFESEGDFDIVTTRAMVAPEKVGKLIRKHIRKGGLLILYLGPNESERIDAIVQGYKKEGYFKLIFKKSSFTERNFNVLILVRKR